jgi:hypothetical protein
MVAEEERRMISKRTKDARRLQAGHEAWWGTAAWCQRGSYAGYGIATGARRLSGWRHRASGLPR